MQYTSIILLNFFNLRVFLMHALSIVDRGNYDENIGIPKIEISSEYEILVRVGFYILQ